MLFDLLANAVATTPSTATVDWSSLIDASSFNGIITGVTTALSIVIPVCITLMSIPIVWGFIRKMIKKH